MRRGVELDLGWIFRFGLGGLGVGLVGIIALTNGLEDARGVPLCEFDLLQRFWLWSAPFPGKVEKGGGGVERVGGLPGYPVGAHGSLCAVKRLLGKHLHVCLPRSVVGDGIIVGALGLGRLEALNQRPRKVEAFVVGRMQALADNLVDGVVLAPVGNGGLDRTELIGAVDESTDFGYLERGGERLGHGGSAARYCVAPPSICLAFFFLRIFFRGSFEIMMLFRLLEGEKESLKWQPAASQAWRDRQERG